MAKALDGHERSILISHRDSDPCTHIWTIWHFMDDQTHLFLWCRLGIQCWPKINKRLYCFICRRSYHLVLKKQLTIALSMAKVEYIMATHIAKQVLWHQTFCEELSIPQLTTLTTTKLPSPSPTIWNFTHAWNTSTLSYTSYVITLNLEQSTLPMCCHART